MTPWRVYERGTEASKKGTVTALRHMGDFATKREAVMAMLAKREPKTQINRYGRDFIYQAARGR